MTAAAWLSIGLFAALALALALGLPVAFTLAGVSLIFAGIGVATGTFDASFLDAFPNRVFGVMGNETLLAVPLFVFMGVMLERSQIADRLLTAMAGLFGSLRGGLAISVMLVGAVLAASTGIVGATVVTMGLIALPTMLRAGYDPRIAAGTICSAGTLGQIIPPSVILVLLGDVLGNAYQKAQLAQGVYAPKTVSVGDLFAGAMLPGLVLVGGYLVYLIGVAWLQPQRAPALPAEMRQKPGLKTLFAAVLPPVFLIALVLGSIIGGVATPTEAAAIGAVGALLLSIPSGQLTLKNVRETAERTALITSMVYAILIAAALFSLVFRGFGGDDMVHEMLTGLPGGVIGALIIVNLTVFPDRLHRDHLHCRAAGGATVAGARRRSDLARRAAGDEPADLIPDPAIRIRVVLPARCGAEGLPDHGDLSWRDAVHRDPADHAAGAGAVPGASDVASGANVGRRCALSARSPAPWGIPKSAGEPLRATPAYESAGNDCRRAHSKPT